MPQIQTGETDDGGFIRLVNSLLSGMIRSYKPDELWVIQIKNWFDHKWLRFSGIGKVEFRFPAFMNRDDGALDEFSQEKVTFPPFNPNRILAQYSYVRSGEEYSEVPLPRLPHSWVRRPSEANLHRRIENFTGSAAFVWYSSNTVVNDRGSVMIYIVSNEQIDTWFAAFKRNGTWNLQFTKGVKREGIQKLLDKG